MTVLLIAVPLAFVAGWCGARIVDRLFPVFGSAYTTRRRSE